jgi:hypothetical protein
MAEHGHSVHFDSIVLQGQCANIQNGCTTEMVGCGCCSEIFILALGFVIRQIARYQLSETAERKRFGRQNWEARKF